MERKVAIKTENLEKSFIVGEKPYGALRGVDLEIEDGEFAIIYGPSGSGKSTLLNCIMGLEKPTAGKIWIEGERLDEKEHDERADIRSKTIGVVHQQPIWIKALSILENVSLPLIIQGIDEKDAQKKALKSLETVGMTEYLGHKPTEISGGQQQRVSLARALVTEPTILILDEPTGNLDTHSSDEVMNLLKQLNEELKRTIVLVTHNLVYLPYADKTISIVDGKVDKMTTDTTKILTSETGAKK